MINEDASTLEFNVTEVFNKNWDAFTSTTKTIRHIINMGSSRSSKSYSIAQLLVLYALTTPNKTIDIVRKTLPELRKGSMKDFFDVLDEHQIYNEAQHNKSNNQYRFQNGTVVSFFGIMESARVKGSSRDVLYIDECDELNDNDYLQLKIRTKDKIIYSFNPGNPNHWIFQVMEGNDAICIHSTYKDNPYLSDGQIKEIEDLQKADETYWKIYGLGERVYLTSQIYTHYTIGDYQSDTEKYYGVDFGFSHFMGVVEIAPVNGTIYVKQILYQNGLTSSDIISLFNKLNLNKQQDMLCDGARPEIIEDLKRAGYNAKGANKAVLEGINSIKQTPLVLDRNSTDLIKEFKNYKWKSNGNIILQEPVKAFDELVDATRYARYYHYLQNKVSGPAFKFKIRTIK